MFKSVFDHGLTTIQFGQVTSSQPPFPLQKVDMLRTASQRFVPKDEETSKAQLRMLNVQLGTTYHL